VTKETANAKRLKEEKKLDKMSQFGIGSRYGDRGVTGKLLDKAMGTGDGYGTSRSAAARAAGYEEGDRIYKKEGLTAGEVMSDKRPRKAMREAAAEERRESRGMKAGGYVKAADGCAKKGKTKGTMR
jgi:hypothetical protein